MPNELLEGVGVNEFACISSYGCADACTETDDRLYSRSAGSKSYICEMKRLDEHERRTRGREPKFGQEAGSLDEKRVRSP